MTIRHGRELTTAKKENVNARRGLMRLAYRLPRPRRVRRLESTPHVFLLPGASTALTGSRFARHYPPVKASVCLFCLGATVTAFAAVKDVPFKQDVAVRITAAPNVEGADLWRLAINRDGITYVLTDKGVARVFDQTLALDRSYRPLAGKLPKDISLGRGELYYLFDDQWLSNGDAGKPAGRLPAGEYGHIAVSETGDVLVAGSDRAHYFGEAGAKDMSLPEPARGKVRGIFTAGRRFMLLAGDTVYELGNTWRRIHQDAALTTLAFRREDMLVGTHDGYYGVDLETGRETLPRQTRLPVTDITRIVPVADGLWVGTTRGVFFQRTKPTEGPALPDGPNGIRYYASRRWLVDDYVVDLALDPDGHLWVLTKTGLNKIEFRPMTLAEKAAYFDRKIRARHIRYGFSAERRLPKAGDLASGEMIDTDNDGGWSSYYLAGQAFRYAVTGDPAARRQAWETFAALERLQSITPLDGFPARTYERRGFKFSDPDRWRPSPENGWDWKGTTSSDEIASHTFAYAVLYECAAQTDAEKKRIADCLDRIMNHIVRNNLYLIDVDGKPTLWARWHPEYVNWYPPTIFDRRLNSSEITASLQLAYRLTGKALYREKAFELFTKHGYLDNIRSSMQKLSYTPGYLHQGNDLGTEWNHSDDELAFVTYWVLCRFAFNAELKAEYAQAVKDHWEIEKAEKSPFWNFVYAGCNGQDCDAEGAVWTLKGVPLDAVTWRVENSHRQDLTKLPDNFMKREMVELLPPGERQITRCNSQPFILDGGDGGHTEFSGDEFLLGYWMGRYLRAIE
jgi:hypothetical protein